MQNEFGGARASIASMWRAALRGGSFRLRYEERRRMSPDERSKAPVVEPRRRSWRLACFLAEIAAAQGRLYGRDPCPCMWC